MLLLIKNSQKLQKKNISQVKHHEKNHYKKDKFKGTIKKTPKKTTILLKVKTVKASNFQYGKTQSCVDLGFPTITYTLSRFRYRSTNK